MSRTRPTLLTAAALLAAAAPAAQAAGFSSSARPHSTVVTYDRGDVRTERLELQLRRVDHRLRGTMHLAVKNVTSETQTRTLIVGRCVSGTLAGPRCETGTSVTVRIAPGKTATVGRTITLHQPSSKLDSVQLSLVKPGASQPFAYHADARLLVRGRAWRGAGANKVYGVRFAGTGAATRLQFDIPATSATGAYASLIWEGTAAPSAAATTLSHCTGDTCTDTLLRPAGSRSAPLRFGQRFDLERDDADAIGVRAADPSGTQLFTARLPWPA